MWPGMICVYFPLHIHCIITFSCFLRLPCICHYKVEFAVFRATYNDKLSFAYVQTSHCEVRVNLLTHVLHFIWHFCWETYTSVELVCPHYVQVESLILSWCYPRPMLNQTINEVYSVAFCSHHSMCYKLMYKLLSNIVPSLMFKTKMHKL